MKCLKVYIMTLSLMLMACEDLLLGEDPANTPENNFQLLWEEFDRWYSGFILQNIDWDSLYAIYRPQMTPQTTDAELWDIITAMLTPLNDIHTELRNPATGRLFNSSNPTDSPNPLDFDLNLIRRKYLSNYQELGGSRLVFGELTDKFGYIYIRNFEGEGRGPAEWVQDIDQIISQFENMEGLVVDLRQTSGGLDTNALRLAGVFADRKLAVFTTETRNGPNYDDFDAPTAYYVEPIGPKQFVRPIVLITDQVTRSAAELFTMLMVSLPHVTHIGKTTVGGFSAFSFYRYLPNGWAYAMSHQLIKWADGRNVIGIGIVPEIHIQNTEDDIRNGTDKVLDFAIDYLN